MVGIEKYDNLKEVIPNLMPVLRDAIQSEFLEIKKINKECEKYIASCTNLHISDEYVEKQTHCHDGECRH